MAARSKAKGWATALFLACLIGAGCGRVTHHPAYRYDEEGKRVAFKRYPIHMAADRVTRFDKIAYLPGESLDPEDLSPDEREVMQRFGPPEAVRKPFKSNQKEMVDEWLYRRSNYLVQFIDGRKVYDGEVTDLEETLLEWGYPHHVMITRDDTGTNRETWVYDEFESTIGANRQVYSFANGKLLAKEGMN